jgi:hypothetical protein
VQENYWHARSAIDYGTARVAGGVYCFFRQNLKPQAFMGLKGLISCVSFFKLEKNNSIVSILQLE